MVKKGCTGLGLGLIACVVAFLLWHQGALVGFENAAWQWRVAHFARPTPATSRLRIIALDQKSLDWGRKENGLSWPWPRQAYATVLAFCKRAGVKAVALDVLFSEPSLHGVADDEALALAMRENGPVVLSYTLAPPGEVAAAGESRPSALAISGFAQWLAKSQAPVLPQAVTMPVPELAASAAMLANISSHPDSDGVFRRAPLFVNLAGQPVPSLALAAYLAGAPGPVSLSLKKNHLQIGELAVPLDAAGQAILNFRGPSRTIPTISLAAVVQSELQLEAGEKPVIDPAEFKNAYVFLGMTAPGLYDLRAIPIDGVYPGVEIHATMLDNLLSQDFLYDSPAWLAAALTLFFGVLAAVTILFCRTAWQSSLAFALLLPLPFAAGFIAYGQEGVWLPVAVQATAVLCALISGVVFNFATEGRKKRYIKRAFSQYLHPTVIEQLVANPERLRLGGEKRELSIFFSDLAGFTGMSERLDPERLTLLLNEYLSAMTDIILESGGTIDKYEGDAIIAFWNAPLTQIDHASRAVQTALRCQERLAELRPDFKARFGCDLFMRIGINTGPVVVGNLGSAQRFDYSILGDNANVAARLEGVNKEFDTEILISEACRRQLPAGVKVREIARVGVVGRKEPITVFEPLAAGSIEDGLIDRFAAALALYYQGEFAEARSAFQDLAADDGVAARYAARCREALDNPPFSWDGVWRMGSK